MKWAGLAGVAIGGFAAYTGVKFDMLKENSLLAFTTMLGSGEKARQMMANLQKFAIATPFTLSGLIPATQQLIAFGFQADEVIPILTRVGNAVAGLGLGQEGLQ